MQNPLAVLNSIQIGKPGRVLVLHADGYQLNVALVQSGVAGATIRARAGSRALDPPAALAQALEGLRAGGVRRLPKKAVLISASAITALLDLPVDPEHPRPRDQMHELVRWELESLFSEQSLRWTIGAHLMGRGYLTPEQRTAIADRQALQALDTQSSPDVSDRPTKVRFGEVAVEAGLVSREQVDECLALRDELLPDDDQLVCGWLAQTRPVEDELADDDDGGGFPWLALAVPESQRRIWAKACKRQGIILETAYASLGAGFARLQVAPAEEALYLEVHPEQFAVMRGRPGGVRSLRIGSTQNGRLAPEDAVGLCREELTPDIQRLHLLAPHHEVDTLTEAITDLLGIEVVRVGGSGPGPASEPDGQPHDRVADEILAVARHVLGTLPRGALPSVSAQPPRPALWQRRELLPYAAAAAVVLGVLGNDVRMRVQSWQNQAELKRLDQVFEEQMEMKRIADQIRAESRRLKLEVDEQERVVARLAAQVSGLERLTRRREQMPKVLEQIAAACNDEMFVQAVNLPPAAGALVQMRAWALTNTGAQLFVTTLNNTLEELGGTVRNSRIVAAPGPRNLSGYQIEVWLAFREGFGA